MLKPIEKKMYLHPGCLQRYTVRFDGNFCHIESSEHQIFVMSVSVQGNQLRLVLNPFQSLFNPQVWLSLGLEFLLGHFSEIKLITVVGEDPRLQGLVYQKVHSSPNEWLIRREDFFQWPWPWQFVKEEKHAFETWTETQNRSHPIRPRFQPGLFYQRYVASIDKTLSFRSIDVEKDLAIFHAWHNHPRVYGLWELNKPMEELKTYIKNGLNDPHQIPLILEVDGVSIGYFEIYWAKEDRLGPYYESDPYDRGFHFLIGHPRYLGLNNTRAAVISIMHFIFLNESKTQRIVVEPRSDNQKVLRYAQEIPGWRFIKEFDFPHKRAALLMAHRNEFFSGEAL